MRTSVSKNTEKSKKKKFELFQMFNNRFKGKIELENILDLN